ncbi:SpaA isopeptide-forming pilin-related protein, partial [Criibacterium bergeronii]|uniref:SpaA isopeptide-forming pilin-related protein n=1 Tax=Criibacterium bergeronii TaxID=1871336 RepID=UPI00242A83CD
PNAELKVVVGEDVNGTIAKDSNDSTELKWTSSSTARKFTLGEGTYTMIETQAPSGYDVAENITFKITSEGKIQIRQANGDYTDATNSTIQMQDKKQLVKKEITFSKVEVNGSAELPNAELKVVVGEDVNGTIAKDSNDSTELKWTSSSTARKFTLGEGTYTMIETQAPSGYDVAENITFKITSEGKIQIRQANGDYTDATNSTIQMQDKKQ